MPIRFRCPHCDRKLSISSRQAGSEVSCPSCQERLRVPEGQEPTSPVERSASDVATDATGLAVSTVPSERDASEGWQRRKRPLDWDEEMDLTPMVDVTFLLLIFFMVTSSYSIQKTIEIPRPDPEQEGVQQQPRDLSDLESTNIIVLVDSDNTIRVDEIETSVDDLVSEIRSRFLESGKTELVINAAGDAFHETVVSVIDAANLVGLARIRIAQTVSEGAVAGAGGN